MKYNEAEVEKYLTSNGRALSSYLVILGDGNISDILYSVYENVLFFEMIEDDELYLQCVDYVKKHGITYASDEELKNKRPDIFFG